MSANHVEADRGVVCPPFDLVRATVGDWETVQRWAAAEGRNPSVGDTRLFMAKDPKGFRVGHQDSRLVSSVSVVRYDDFYAHIGHLLVAPDLDAVDYRRATFTAAVQLAKERAIGLDADPDQLDFYHGHGFEPAWRAIRYQGRPSPYPRTSPHVDLYQRQDRIPTAAMDAAVFPAQRHAFAIGFAALPGRYAVVYRTRNVVQGYGVLRPAHHGIRIGPVYADSEIAAAALLGALCDRACQLNASTVAIDVPDNNPTAMALAEAFGLHHDSETTRMYRPGRNGVPPAKSSDQTCFALTSLELG